MSALELTAQREKFGVRGRISAGVASPAQEVRENDCRSLAVYKAFGVFQFDTAFPQTAAGFVGCGAFVLKENRNIKGERKIPCGVAGFRGHRAFGAVEVIRQTNAEARRIEFT